MTIQELFNLSGKVAVITGGHSGLGRGIADALAEAGADIVIAARRFELCREVCAEITGKYGVRCLPVKTDVSLTGDADNLVAAAVGEFGRLDILVNSAGVGGIEKPLLNMSDEEFEGTLNINLKGIFRCSRAAARQMKTQKEGKIINLSSVLGLIASRYMADYCTSKAGVIHLTRVLALELVRYNIQVNALCPGYFLTPMNREFFSSEAGQKLVENDIPMRRLGEVGELKGIAVYLASKAASFTTGAAFVVDGGQSIW